MLNELNIDIFDFIFSSNIELKIEEKNLNELYEELDRKISKISKQYDFWNEYKYYFNDKCVSDASTFGDHQYIYNSFPKLKIETKKIYLEYKKNQIKTSITNNGEFEEKEFEKITKDICNEGKKEILDYCKNVGIIKYEGRVFIAADDNPAYDIIYDNISAIIYTEDEIKSLKAENMIIVNGSGNYISDVKQISHSNDEEFFEIVMNKLQLLIQEGVTIEKVRAIGEACKEKNKSKVVNFLKDVASGTISSLIATGILYKFGIGQPKIIIWGNYYDKYITKRGFIEDLRKDICVTKFKKVREKN